MKQLLPRKRLVISPINVIWITYKTATIFKFLLKDMNGSL